MCVDPSQLAPTFRKKFVMFSSAFAKFGASLDTPSGDGFVWSIRHRAHSLACTSDALPLNSAASWLLACDKLGTSQVLRSAEIPVPHEVAIFRDGVTDFSRTSLTPHDFDVLSSASGKAVVKPGRATGGKGVCITKDFQTASQAVGSLLQKWDYALVQEYIPGPEYRVAFLDNDVLVAYEKEPAVLTLEKTGELGEAVANLRAGGRPVKINAIEEPIINLARRAHRALGLRFSGVDIRSCENMVVLEVNGNPGFSVLGDYEPQLAAGIIERIACAVLAMVETQG